MIQITIIILLGVLVFAFIWMNYLRKNAWRALLDLQEEYSNLEEDYNKAKMLPPIICEYYRGQLFALLNAAKETASKDSPPCSAGYVCPTIPIEMLTMLEDTQMLDLHDDNGPGKVECPVCGESIAMRWNWGNRLDNPDDVEHHVFCPVGWAKRRR